MECLTTKYTFIILLPLGVVAVERTMRYNGTPPQVEFKVRHIHLNGMIQLLF